MPLKEFRSPVSITLKPFLRVICQKDVQAHYLSRPLRMINSDVELIHGRQWLRLRLVICFWQIYREAGGGFIPPRDIER